MPVLDPGHGRTMTGRLWCSATNNRPWRGPGYPAAAYIFSKDRKSEHSACHERLSRSAPGRRLCRVWPPGHCRRKRHATAGILLGSNTAQILRHPAATKSRLAGRRCGGSPLSRAPSWCCSKRSAGSELTITSFRCAVAPTRFRLSIPMKSATQPRDGKCAGQFLRRHDVLQFHIVG